MSELVERLRYPRAGWISLVLLGVMALALAWSVQGANWLDQMDFLVPVALFAVIAGTLLGMLRGSIVWALPIGALIGTGVVLWTVGGEYYPALDQAGRLLALRTEFIDWLIVVLGTGYPPQLTPYAIGLGVLMFATAFAAAFAVYRHHRVLDAIVLLGAALIVNLSATLTDLFYQLLLFVVAAMLLWLRAALVDRQDGWQRRRVNETLEVPTAIMRSGILSAGAAIALAWLLTAVAVAAPLTDAWRSMDGVWTGVQDQFDSVFGNLTNPQSRISGNSFGSSFIVQGEWVSVDDEVLVLAAPRALYLRTVTYDIYNGHGWDSSESVQRTVDAGQLLFNELTSERSTVPDAVSVERIGIEMRQPIGRDLFTAGSPLEIYAPAVVSEPFGQPLLGHIQHANALGEGQSYEQDVQLSTATEAELGAAGDDYPEEVADLYLDASRVTDRVADLAVQVTEGAENNYERARALASYLSHDPSFSYSTKAGVPPSDADLVDFFLFDPELGQQRLLPVLRQRDGDDGEVTRPPGTPRRRLRPRRAPGRRHLPRPRGERPRVGGDLLPRIRLGDLRGDEVDQPGLRARQRGHHLAGRSTDRRDRPLPRGSRTWSSSCAAPAARLRSRRRTRSRAPSIRTSRMSRPPTSPRAGPTPCSSPSSCSAA